MYRRDIIRDSLIDVTMEEIIERINEDDGDIKVPCAFRLKRRDQIQLVRGLIREL